MHLRSKKQLPEMVRPLSHTTATSNVTSASEMVTNPQNTQSDTKTIPSSGTVTVITPVGSPNPAQVSLRSHTTASTGASVSQAIPSLGIV